MTKKKEKFINHMENIAKNVHKSDGHLEPEFKKYCENNFPGSELTWKYTQIIGFIEIRYDDGL